VRSEREAQDRAGLHQGVPRQVRRRQGADPHQFARLRHDPADCGGGAPRRHRLGIDPRALFRVQGRGSDDRQDQLRPEGPELRPLGGPLRRDPERPELERARLVELVVQQAVNGIYLGCLYVMVALGLTLIYGVLNQINFAHADFVTVGAFTAFFTATRFATKVLGLPDTGAYLLSMFAALGAGALLGLAVNAAVFAPLRDRGDELRPLIATIGVSVLLENAQLALFGPIPYQFDSPFARETLRIGDRQGLRHRHHRRLRQHAGHHPRRHPGRRHRGLHGAVPRLRADRSGGVRDAAIDAGAAAHGPDR